MSSSWNTDTIEGMEETARNEETRDCNVKIRGEWLEVVHLGKDKFDYKWGKNRVSRDTAKAVLATR